MNTQKDRDEFIALCGNGPKVQALVADVDRVASRKTELDRLAKFAASHGHEVFTDYDNDCIRVGIVWINSSLGTRGTEWSSADTLAKLRDLLGY